MSTRVDVTVKRSFKSLLEIAAVDAAIMREVGLYARELIVTRTRQGQGPNGPFPALSEGYAARKRAALGTAEPDIAVSGATLNDLTIVEVSENRVVLGWNK